ncbi:NUDIX hydrolase [Croceicoccus naphthovorans]|uniref:Uncharacterized protein n=1 Tax=Croceicoccus naphthovorans TaxID=1348774 RepID=A0A0G3XEP8_9SPHN|nr:NUDIX domain-containing protein [Croceicoccus naphthovorans]AKM08863.1 hypothetical protein AB433_00905 [Croceicoccus naphthovorans]MBB3989382.1 8-oxo-dGTP pyrophosphatase MutT (NUDIX family) [Croceicoccus naphthovorans]
MSAELRPAATLIVLRNAEPAPEILLVRRSAAMAFGGGAYVFPGGSVDEDDAIAANSDDPWRVASVCAARETLEEIGLLIGIEGPVAAKDAERARARLQDGERFSQILHSEGWRFDPQAFVPYARWCPPDGIKRKFDTRFFLADVGSGNLTLRADGSETTDHLWTSANAMLSRADRGEVSLLFPTLMNLRRLANMANFDEAKADAKAFEPRIVGISWVMNDGVRYGRVEEGYGYPTEPAPLKTRRQ